MQNNLVLGFDFGMKYIGVATGQTVTNTANALTTLRAIDGIPDWQEIANLITEWRPNILLVGIPLNMDDSEQQLTKCAQKFANRLRHKYNLPVELVDERLSTWEAKQNIKVEQRNTSRTKQLDAINAESAAILVNQWLVSRAAK